jgi:hypothetical protein
MEPVSVCRDGPGGLDEPPATDGNVLGKDGMWGRGEGAGGLNRVRPVESKESPACIWKSGRLFYRVLCMSDDERIPVMKPTIAGVRIILIDSRRRLIR